MKKNLLIIFILTFTIIACKEKSSELNRNETIEYYPNKPKVVFKRTVHKTDFDSVFYFYDNGMLFKKGKQNKNNQKFGIWKLYDKESKLREIREWFVLDRNQLINRAWFLNKKGDTLAWRYDDSIYNQKEFINDTLGTRATCYDVFDFNKDTISLREPIKAVAYCNSPLIRDYNSEIRVFFDSESEDFNSPFPTDSLIRLEVFKNLKNDTINQSAFPEIKPENYKYVAVFGCYFKNPGKKLLRGYMEEYAIGPFKDNDADSIISRKYFEKWIYVKDTIKINHSVQHSI